MRGKIIGRIIKILTNEKYTWYINITYHGDIGNRLPANKLNVQKDIKWILEYINSISDDDILDIYQQVIEEISL